MTDDSVKVCEKERRDDYRFDRPGGAIVEVLGHAHGRQVIGDDAVFNPALQRKLAVRERGSAATHPAFP